MAKSRVGDGVELVDEGVLKVGVERTGGEVGAPKSGLEEEAEAGAPGTTAAGVAVDTIEVVGKPLTSRVMTSTTTSPAL